MSLDREEGLQVPSLMKATRKLTRVASHDIGESRERTESAPTRSLSLQCLQRSPIKALRNSIGSGSSNLSLSSFLHRDASFSMGSFSLDDEGGHKGLPPLSSAPHHFWTSPNKKKKHKKRGSFLPPLNLSSTASVSMKRNLSFQSLRTDQCSFDTRESLTLPGSLDELSQNEIGFLAPLESGRNGSILPPICTKDARSRSYLFGRITSGGSLLGIEEMIRYFPDRKMNIFVGTWNMNGQNPPKSLNDFLLPESVQYLPDMYVVGTQEGFNDRKEWEILMQACLGPSHVLFDSASLGVLHVAVFLRRDLIWFCSVAEQDSLSTRPGTMVKTKGAVAIAFVFFGVSFLFINSHLTAHEKKIKERILDYEKIAHSLNLPKNLTLKPQYINKDVTARFDYVFWCGDLNFRIDQDRNTVLNLLQDTGKPEGSYETLLQHDQLKKAMEKGAAYRGFQEGQITFGPSYKYDANSLDFDTIKQRVPSYTDRVLYRSKTTNSVDCLCYSSVPHLIGSDHRPVFGVFQINLRPGRDDIPLAAGLFIRDVYVEGSKRRAKNAAKELRKSGSVVCSLM